MILELKKQRIGLHEDGKWGYKHYVQLFSFYHNTKTNRALQ